MTALNSLTKFDRHTGPAVNAEDAAKALMGWVKESTRKSSAETLKKYTEAMMHYGFQQNRELRDRAERLAIIDCDDRWLGSTLVDVYETSDGVYVKAFDASRENTIEMNFAKDGTMVEEKAEDIRRTVRAGLEYRRGTSIVPSKGSRYEVGWMSGPESGGEFWFFTTVGWIRSKSAANKAVANLQEAGRPDFIPAEYVGGHAGYIEIKK